MSGSVTISEAPTTGLGRLLTENRFFVPTHQRDYSWTEYKVQKLLEDVIESMERPDRFYFIGLMVFMGSDDGRLRVLDGQQRLATTMIILSAIRSWFRNSESGNTTADQIQSDFIGRSELGETEILPKLSLNLNNDELFQRFVISGRPIEEVKTARAKTNKNAPNASLLDAIIYCHGRVSDISSEKGDGAGEYLVRLTRYIRDSVIVVRLTVPNEANAFRVFETLNDRGLDLSAVDLLKNYLFGLAHDSSTSSLSQIESRWAQITQTLESEREEDFLRVFWTSRHGRTQLDQIFEDVRAKCRTGREAIELSVDILEAAEHYTALANSGDAVWAPYSREAKVSIDNLRLLTSKQIRPVILSAIKRFTESEFGKLLRLLEVVVVRWQIVGGGRTGALEILCARLAHLIWQSDVASAKDARIALDSVYLSDEDFRDRFQKKANLSNPKGVYILRRIEERERQNQLGANWKELSPSQTLSVEHILPKNPSTNWAVETRADPDFVADCAQRLGNTCLLTEARNREAGQASFQAKREIYSNSDLLTTQHIATFEKWDRKSVDHHQSWLAKRAVTAWSFPSE